LCTSVQAGNWLDKVWWADVNEHAARREVIGKSAREEMEFTAEWCAGYGDLWWKRMEEIAKDYQWK
jgi:hypothetical protein